MTAMKRPRFFRYDGEIQVAVHNPGKRVRVVSLSGEWEGTALT